MEYSKYQNAIFDFIKNSKRNGLIEAVAGSGKTTTIVDAMKMVNGLNIFVAFNKHIAEELVRRGVNARTLHSVGMEICRSRGWFKLNNNKIRNIVLYKMHVKGPIGDLIRLISLMKSNPEMSCAELSAYHNLSCSAEDAVQAFVQSSLEHKVLDFDDLIYMPVVQELPFPKYDYVFVDEAQDLSDIQIKFIRNLCGGRVIAVGDTHQAIYGFRGADHKAMQKIKDEFDAEILPLSISYRCSKKVVAKAKKIVPHIEHWDGSPEGEVKHISLKDFYPKDGDFILCRVTAELVKECLNQISKGKKAIVKGRDIGTDLENYITKCGARPDHSVEMLLMKLPTIEEDNIVLSDKIDSIKALSKGCKTVSDVLERIDTIFSNEDKGIVFMTIHKAKGLEADTIYLLHPGLLPHPRAKLDWQIIQENNLKYVAITRAIRTLILVGD